MFVYVTLVAKLAIISYNIKGSGTFEQQCYAAFQLVEEGNRSRV